MTVEPVVSSDVALPATKREILWSLKRSGGTSLVDLAKARRISKTAVLRHLSALESRGLVERYFVAGRRGRPRAHFRLTERSRSLFPQAYADMTVAALGYVEKKLGREAVVELLEQRTKDLFAQHRQRFAGGDLSARVRELARLRDEGGYMAEAGPPRRGSFVLLEHNCPILAVADKYGEACAVERDLFRRLLRADVDVSHRVVAGDAVCRFLIAKRETGKG